MFRGCCWLREKKPELLELAFFLEDTGPVHNQPVQGLFGCALIGNDIIMKPLLHGLQQRSVSRLLPEVLDAAHGFQELAGKRLGSP